VFSSWRAGCPLPNLPRPGKRAWLLIPLLLLLEKHVSWAG
jgi:hypothetical protein